MINSEPKASLGRCRRNDAVLPSEPFRDLSFRIWTQARVFKQPLNYADPPPDRRSGSASHALAKRAVATGDAHERNAERECVQHTSRRTRWSISCDASSEETVKFNG
jgi:hypothetical protein